MGFLSDVVHGKEKTQSKDALTGDINKAGKQGIGYLRSGATALNNIYNQDPSQVLQSQIGMENKMLRGAADDATMRTRQLIAQRGIGNSSIGLGQEINTQQALADKLAMNNASGIARLRDMQIENAQGRMNVGNSLYGVKTGAAGSGIQMMDQKYRTGGYGDLIVGGAKAYAAAQGGKT